jgi:hypothetical protein
MIRALQVAGALLLWAASAFSDQKGNPKPPKPSPPPRAARTNAPNNGGAGNGGNPNNGGKAPNIMNPAGPVQRFLRMPPEEQERVLEKLPPGQQEQFRQAIAHFQSLPPARKAFVLQQWQSFDRLTPEKQELVRQGIMAFNRLPDDRKDQVRHELATLRLMPETDRTARLNSDDVKKNYPPAEQKILADLSQTLPPDFPLAR